VSFLDKRKQQLGIKSLGDMIRNGDVKFEIDPEMFVHGPKDFDCLADRWSRKEVMGFVGGSGSGKTQVVLEIFSKILENTLDENTICVFVSLEMTTHKIAQRWINLVGHDNPISDRLYVISNYNEDGTSKMLTTESILRDANALQDMLEVDIISMAVDHLHIIQFTQGQGADYNKVCSRVKEIAVELNTFLILLSQTTKGKQGAYCDKPLDGDASYNCSQFKWISSWIISIHQPLGSLAGSCDLNVLAWSYVKIREKNIEDGAKMGVYNLLHYDMESGKLRKLTRDEMFQFNNYYGEVIELRKENEDEDSYAIYDNKIEGKALSDREALLYRDK